MEDIMLAYQRIYDLAQSGNIDEAEKQVETLLKLYPAQKNEAIIKVTGIYIDTNKPIAIAKGIKMCEKLLSSLKDKDLIGCCYYNLSNGYHSQIVESFGKHKTYFLDENDKLIEKCVRGYKEAFDARPNAKIATNLGNLYDEIGRTLEAIQWYDKALKIDNNFGMALGNKAIAINGLARVAQSPLRYRIYAHSLLKKALKNESSITEQSDSALRYFESVKSDIHQTFCDLGKEDLLKDGVDCSCSNKPVDNTGYTKFCLEYDLYVNLHIFDYYCCGNIGDNIAYSIVDDYAGERAKEMFLRIDDIGETFSTARYILWLSRNIKNIDAINKQTLFVNNFDYVAHGLDVGMLKTAYRTAYCCLDKIAYALNYYLDLQIPNQKVDSKIIWFKKTKKSKKSKNNKNNKNNKNQFKPKQDDNYQFRPKLLKQHYSLYGIYATMQEFKDQVSPKHNALEHRYHKLYSIPCGGQSVEDFSRETIEILYTIKCLIVYLICFVENSETTKRTYD